MVSGIQRLSSALKSNIAVYLLVLESLVSVPLAYERCEAVYFLGMCHQDGVVVFDLYQQVGRVARL